MSAFGSACLVADKSARILLPWISMRALDGRFVATDKGRLAELLQKSVGDVLMNLPNGDVVAVELKAEAENKHGNFFIEEWSNLERYTPGWIRTLDTDFLFYHFLATDELYVISFPALREWCFKRDRLKSFPMRRQSKRDQRNDTWGRCVPIDLVGREVGFKLFHPLADAEQRPEA